MMGVTLTPPPASAGGPPLSRKRARDFGVACATLAFLAACGGGSTVRQPAELERVEAPQVTVHTSWRTGRGPNMDNRALGLSVERHSDALFTADARGNVYALNPDNGNEIWRVRTGARLSGGPSVEGDSIYIGTLDGEVIALSRADGTERWRSTVPSEVLAAPASNGRYVAVRSIDGRMTVFSAEDGSRIWSDARTVPPLVLRGTSPPLIVGPVVIYGLETGRVMAMHLDSGETSWEQVVSVPSGRSELERIADINAPLLVHDDTLYAMSYGGDIAALDVYNGTVRWRRSLRSYTGAALEGDRLYVTDEEGTVWALDTASGAAAWRTEALAWRGLSAPAVHSGFVVVTDFDGYVHYLSRDSGDIVGRTRPLSARAAAPPLRADDRLIVADVSGRIVALSAEVR